MARRQPNEPLAALLVEARWSAGELARAVNALGEAHALTLRYDRASVAHWIKGSRPRAPVPEFVAGALSRHTCRLVTPVTPAWSNPRRNNGRLCTHRRTDGSSGGTGRPRSQ